MYIGLSGPGGAARAGAAGGGGGGGGTLLTALELLADVEEMGFGALNLAIGAGADFPGSA